MNATTLEKKLQEIKRTLTVPTNTTLKYKYSKVCMEDNRPSAVSIGYLLGVGTLAVSFAIILLPDIPAIVRHLRWGAKHWNLLMLESVMNVKGILNAGIRKIKGSLRIETSWNKVNIKRVHRY